MSTMAGLPIGVYVPGTSLMHRAPIGVKLAVLLVGVSLLLVLRSPAAVLVGALITALGYRLARIPVRLIAAQVWPMRWFVLALLVLQVLLADWVTALVVVGTMVLAVLLAALVTLTTTTTELLSWMDRALSRIPQGESISLILILTLRAIPVLAGVLDQTRQARVARGATWSSRALLTPVVVRSIGYAHALGEALMARGLDDDAPD